MFCRQCGEKNPDEAVYCKNYGCKLKEEIKKAEIIENATTNQNTNNQQSTTTSSSSSSDSSTWIGCCLCLIGIFIIFAIIGSF